MFRPTFTRVARASIRAQVQQAQTPASVLRRGYADKTLAETVGDAVKKAGQAFKSDGAVGKQFEKGGNIAEAGEAVGGPFSSEGAVGKEFTDSGSVGGNVDKAATDVKQAGKAEANNTSHATGPSVVPGSVQEAAPKGLEEALPESVHPTKKCELASHRNDLNETLALEAGSGWADADFVGLLLVETVQLPIAVSFQDVLERLRGERYKSKWVR